MVLGILKIISHWVLSHVHDGTPFFLMVTDRRSPASVPRLNKARIAEVIISAVITGIMAGAVASYISVQKMDVRVSTLEKQVDKIDDRLEEHIKDTASGKAIHHE